MSKRIKIVNVDNNWAEKSTNQIDWKEWLVCQAKIREDLQWPADNKRRDVDVGDGYQSFDACIQRCCAMNWLTSLLNLEHFQKHFRNTRQNGTNHFETSFLISRYLIRKNENMLLKLRKSHRLKLPVQWLQKGTRMCTWTTRQCSFSQTKCWIPNITGGQVSCYMFDKTLQQRK